MSTLVAVHGGFAGGFYWQDVGDRLERQGYATAVIERLPSHGTDPGSLGDLTADPYAPHHLRHHRAGPGPSTPCPRSDGTACRPRRPPADIPLGDVAAPDDLAWVFMRALDGH